MLLDCPKCQTEYDIDEAVLGQRGRTLRCVKCSHEWFEDSPFAEDEIEEEYDLKDDDYEEEEPYEVQESAEESIEDILGDVQAQLDQEDEQEEQNIEKKSEDFIPDAVRPRKEEEMPDFIAAAKPSLQAQLTGYLTALTLFAVLIGGAFVFKKQITSAWPPAYAIYDLAGLVVPYKGQNLVMESLSAIVAKDEQNRDVLVLKGRILNLADRPMNVPEMRAILRSTNGEDGESWLIDPPVDQIEAGGAFTFTSDYAGVPQGVGSVNLTFVPAVEGV